jgi:hypothetical protein
MITDFFEGVGSGVALLLGLGLLLLLALWMFMPFLVLQLVRTNRALIEEVRTLRSLVEERREGAGGSPSHREEGPDDRSSGPSGS